MPDIEGLLHRGSSADLIKRKRIKVAIIALLIGLVSAIIELPLPVEDAFRAARAHIRERPAPQDIVLVTIDDATLNTVQRSMPSRQHDSIVIDNLMAAGASKVVFDRAHSDPETPAADAAFIEALKRHRGNIWLGASPSVRAWNFEIQEILPHENFREHTQIASMLGKGGPFGLSVTFPTAAMIEGVERPTISALLADYQGPAIWYRPDSAFDPLTIPTISYRAILEGDFARHEIANKSVLIGETHLRSTDYFRFGLGTTLQGAYFHIVGAHTLKRSVPVDLSWYPAILIAALALAAQTLSWSRSRKILWIAAGGLVLAPLPLDELGISVDVMSGLLVLIIASIGFRRIAKKYFSSEVDAFSTSAMPLDKPNHEQDVYALKIANLAELSEEWNAAQMGEFLANLISFIKGPGDAVEVAFEKDVLLWLAPRMGAEALEKHADGLAMMLKMTINHRWQSASGAPALGIDTHYDLPLGQRINKAVQAADEAVTRGLRFIVNNAAYFEARQHRLEMLRLLEKAIRERSIGVGYQPKVDLQTGLVVGAEALIRWRPDGGEFINPQELVLTAEATDMINDLTLIVMDTAFRDAKKALLIDPRFKLAINMSAKSLSDTHFLFDVMTLLGEHRFPGRNLTLELTETAKLEDASIAAQIKALRQRNISLSIDDFGTGQSNMEYLEKLPSNELKIDKRFVQGMASSEESKAIVRATIEIAHSLGKVVVAEGVEDLAVAAELRAMNCDQGQGFLFSHAVAMDELVALIRQRSAAA
ncbi:MAG: EAL domain-containing protein [Erythrobacter sp.]